MLFSNNATKIYERLDNVLRKDKNSSASNIMSDSIKQELNKALLPYVEADTNSAKITFSEGEKEMILEYKIKIKRLKDFIYC